MKNENNDQCVDLYQIVVNVKPAGVSARLEKYRVKRTKANFLPVMLTPELEKAGYSYRMTGRVKVEDLMKVQALGYTAVDWIHFDMYCLTEQKQEALKVLRAHVQQSVDRRLEAALALHKAWLQT